MNLYFKISKLKRSEFGINKQKHWIDSCYFVRCSHKVVSCQLKGGTHRCSLKDMDLKSIVGKAATVCTIAVFLAGTEICRRIWHKKSTCDISALPFLCGLMSCSIWLRYGLLIDDSALIVVNATGSTLQILYLMWYAKFNTSKGTYYKQLAIAISIIGFLYYYTTYYAEGEEARYVAGISACTAGVLFMGSPLSAMAHVLKTKNVDTLPFPMILSTFIMATLWLCYGVLTNDLFVQVPNFLGALLALSQLFLFAIYSHKKPYYELGMTTSKAII
ncbi:sugar transporter SWEET1 [Trichonephila inaurata madagascariensis]|uniref:Sugar transporter SWEET n=1 Tax=Trichonephila inaurata madagascariensis TaxID=2747483 RepID=A0A8X6MHP1_9ARAC|nr:sugar transporter SWEET1 [Trichonephila inaurata madagascariensis]